MRNVLYPSGKASYIAHKEGQRNRQLEEQQRLQRQYAKAKKVRICHLIAIRTDAFVIQK